MTAQHAHLVSAKERPRLWCMHALAWCRFLPQLLLLLAAERGEREVCKDTSHI